MMISTIYSVVSTIPSISSKPLAAASTSESKRSQTSSSQSQQGLGQLESKQSAAFVAQSIAQEPKAHIEYVPPKFFPSAAGAPGTLSEFDFKTEDYPPEQAGGSYEEVYIEEPIALPVKAAPIEFTPISLANEVDDTQYAAPAVSKTEVPAYAAPVASAPVMMTADV